MRVVPSFLRLLASFSFVLVLASSAHGQIVSVNDQTATPTPGSGHDYVHMLNETVNPSNGSVSVRIQVPMPKGRGLTLPFAFAYDSGAFWAPGTSGNAPKFGSNAVGSNYSQGAGGWSYSVPLLSVTGTYWVVNQGETIKYQCPEETGFVFQSPSGGRYSLGLDTLDNSYYWGRQYPCGGGQNQPSNAQTDFFTAGTAGFQQQTKVADADGTTYTFPFQSTGCSFEVSGGISRTMQVMPSSVEDRNGNIITFSNPPSGYCAGPFTETDTAGRTVLSSSGFGSTSTLTVSGIGTYNVTWGSTSPSTSLSSTLRYQDGYCYSTIGNSSGSQGGITAITLPNGQQYSFYYDSVTGLLSKIVYPTGGYVSYTWAVNSQSEFADMPDSNGLAQSCPYTYDTYAIQHRYVSFDGSTVAQQQDFTYSTTWNPNNDYSAWTSKTTTMTTHDLVRGVAYTTQYTYSPVNAPVVPDIPAAFATQIPMEQTVVYKDQNGSTLRTVTKSWLDMYEMQSEKTTLEDGVTSSQNVYTYGSGAQVTEKDEYDYGLTLKRKTLTTYYGPIFDRPCKTVVQDGSGNALAETDHLYDGATTVCATGGTATTSVSNLPAGTHDETNYGPSSTNPRGNATKTIKQCFQGTQACASGNPTSTFTYDETGQMLTSQDPNNNITHYSYADSYTVLSGGANISYTPSANTNALLTTITDPLSHTQNFTYDFNTTQLTVSKDQNSLTTTYLYNDPLLRPTLTSRPDNGQTSVAYNDTALTVTPTMKINTSQNVTSLGLSDGVGHAKQTQITTDPQGTIYTDTAFDGFGRVYTVSNPYRTGSDPTTSSGTTTYVYDAIGRKCLEVPPDGTLPSGGVCPATQPANDLFTTYSLNTTTVTDQTGKSRKSVVDALGRLTQVFEDPTGLDYETDYAYDALGNLLSVTQKGGSSNSALWRTRTFIYDSLSRLLTSNNPEVGTITYKYDSDANCASPNSFIGLLVSKTDARGIRTCAQYDAINREVVLNYSNGDPTVTTTYDQTACLGLSACQNIGHRTSMTDAVGSESWSYQVDAANNRSVHVEQRTTNSITKTSTYYLDQAGNVTQVVYPTGRVVNYTFNAANRPITATDGSNGITYSTDFQTAPTGCLANAVCYTPQGSFYALSIGQTSSFTGLNLSHSYNSRLQPSEFKASSTGGNAIDITYGFIDPITTHNAGHVYSITNNLDTTRSQNFAYDSLNRITSALTTSTHATSPSHCWGETYNPDPWGNLQSIAATTNSNYTGCSEESGFSAAPDGNNHLNIFSYDASGNTQSDGVNSYTWDAESQLKTAAGVTYTYDGDGRRVSKSSGKLYWYGSGGDILAETDASGNTTAEYIFFGGKRVAMLPAGGNPIYYIEDLLGTSRVITTNAGTVCYDADFYPYGGERAYTNTCAQNYKFEGKERDSETGNDDFGARYYSNRFGRWLSADWSSVPVPVPYANLTNPQTLNLYAMVSDDPESFADLDGHFYSDIAAVDGYRGAEPDPSLPDVGSVDDPGGTSSQQSKAQQQPLNSITVLGNQVDLKYASDLSPEQKLTASNHYKAAADLLNAHADDLSQSQKDAIGNVKSISIVGPNSLLGVTGKGEITMSTSYLNKTSTQWTASNLAHEGEHMALSGKFKGKDRWRSEQAASKMQEGVGRAIGMIPREIFHLMLWNADSNRAEMQRHMVEGFRD
jgi:RHS repeat-associated protein